jgi:hypothetical protein
MHLLEGLLDDGELVRGVVDDEVAREADGRCLAAQPFDLLGERAANVELSIRIQP